MKENIAVQGEKCRLCIEGEMLGEIFSAVPICGCYERVGRVDSEKSSSRDVLSILGALKPNILCGKSLLSLLFPLSMYVLFSVLALKRHPRFVFFFHFLIGCYS